MMVTVKATAEARSQVTELTAIFEAKIVDVGYDALTIMVAGEPDRLDAFSRSREAVRHRRDPAHRPHRAAAPSPASPPGSGPSRPPAPNV